MDSTDKTTRQGPRQTQHYLPGSAAPDPQANAPDPWQTYVEAREAHRREARELNREARAAARRQALERLHGHAGIPPRFAGLTFASYQAQEPAQQRAKALAERYAAAVAQGQARGVNLVLIGSPGTGKTHIACAILAHVIEAGRTGVFTRMGEILRAFRDSYSDGTPERDVIARYTTPDLLVIDEIGVSIGREETRQATLFDVFNSRYEQAKPTVVMGNLTRDQMTAHLGERIARRLEADGSPVIPFDWPPYEPGSAS